MGSSMRLGNSRWSAMVKLRTQGVEDFTLGKGGLGWFEQVMSRAFPGSLGWSGTFRNVNQLLSSMYEVLVKSPVVLGVCCRCCLLHPGGSWGQSDIIRVEVKFGAQQINFMRKSVVKTWYTIRNKFISRYFGWSDMVGFAKILWSEVYYYLSK